MMLTIKQLRKKVEDIDTTIIRKLSDRQKVSIKIGKLKTKSGDKVVDTKRELKLMRLYQSLSIKYHLKEDFVKRLFKIIIHNSRQLQK